jgi:hypothetical protein
MTNNELTIEEQIAQTKREYLMANCRAVYLGFKLNRRTISERIEVEVEAMRGGITAKEFADMQIEIDEMFRND